MIENVSNMNVRANNKKRLTRLLFRSGQMTIQEIATKIGISQPTAATILKELADAGLVTEGDVLGSTGGRKAQCHNPVLDAKYSVGVDVSGDMVRLVLVDLGSNIIARKIEPYAFNYADEDWRYANSLIRSFVEENEIPREKLLEIGFSIDAPMRGEEIVIENEEFAQIDLQKAATFFDFPVQFRNAAKVAALAQVWGENIRDTFVFVRLGNTMQGAMVNGGLPIDFNKINCEFGMLLSRGDEHHNLNDLVGAKALLERTGSASIDEFIERANRGDDRCNTELQSFVDSVAVLIYNLHSIFGWEIVIGGRMAQLVDEYYERINEKVCAFRFLAKPENALFTISDYKAFDAAVGGALLPIDSYLSEI